MSSSEPTHVRQLNAPPANATILVDGRFRYRTDGRGRTVTATATLDVIDLKHPRSGHSQDTLADKLPGDHAGHLFARIFKGPGQKINLVPMEGLQVNRRQYAQLERQWRRAIERGESVEVEVTMRYASDSRRPDKIYAKYRIGDDEQLITINNRPKRTQ